MKSWIFYAIKSAFTKALFRCEGSLKTTSELMGLDIDELRRALTARVMQATKVKNFTIFLN